MGSLTSPHQTTDSAHGVSFARFGQPTEPIRLPAPCRREAETGATPGTRGGSRARRGRYFNASTAHRHLFIGSDSVGQGVLARAANREGVKQCVCVCVCVCGSHCVKVGTWTCKTAFVFLFSFNPGEKVPFKESCLLP